MIIGDNIDKIGSCTSVVVRPSHEQVFPTQHLFPIFCASFSYNFWYSPVQFTKPITTSPP